MDECLYGKLDVEQQTICVATILPRLVAIGSRGKLRIVLNIFSLRNKPDFEVLSYSSTEAGTAVTKIDMNGFIVPISASLESALRHVRSESKVRPLHIWVHQVEALVDLSQARAVREAQRLACNVRKWAKSADYCKVSPLDITAAMLFESLERTSSPWDNLEALGTSLPALEAPKLPQSTTLVSDAPPHELGKIGVLPNHFRSRLYRKLDRKKNQIRVATILPCSNSSSHIRLSLETVSLSDNLDFEALSYCWGDPSIKETIIIDNKPLPVTSNLHAALSAFRNHASGQKVRIWIDAICINQADSRERDWQVTLMGEVYTRARNVRTWLGPGDLSGPGRTALAFDQLRFFTSKTKVEIADEEILGRLDMLCDLFRNPYWHRRWITQEIVLSRNISIYCGSSVELDVDLRALYSTLDELATHLQTLYPYHGDRQVWDVVDHDKEIWKVHQPIQEILNAISPVTAFDKPLPQHPYLLRDIRGAEQKLDHDCVYGILGLLKRDLGHTLVEPNYDLPIEDVFQDFAYKLMTASKSLAFLYEAYPEDRRLPTWVPDLRVTSRDNSRYIPDEVPLDRSPDDGILNATFRTAIRFPEARNQRRTNMLAPLDHLFNASAGTKFFAALPAKGVIHLRGLFVDHIVDCSAHDKGLRDMHPTTLMEGWIPMDWTDIYTTAKKYSRVDHHETFEDELLIRTLCADCVLPPDAPARRMTTRDALGRLLGIKSQRDNLDLAILHPTNFLDTSMSLYRFFSIADGRIGITFGDIQDGDMIVVVASLNMPIIVRGSQYADPEDLAAAANRELLDPAYKGRSLMVFKLVGSCYVHGLMDGEAVLEASQDRFCGVEEVFEDLFLI